MIVAEARRVLTSIPDELRLQKPPRSSARVSRPCDALRNAGLRGGDFLVAVQGI